jgi:hypothetical protein
MTATQYQAGIYKLLVKLFGPSLVRSEWDIRRDAADAFLDPRSYAPRVDVAVGPFNKTVDSVERDVQNILEAAKHELVQEIIATSYSQNEGHFIHHKNPRCLLAIEVEFSGSSKHILGDIANASMIGLVGVVVGSRKNIEKIERVGRYVRRLRTVKKAPPDLFANVAFLSTVQFLKLLEKHLQKGSHFRGRTCATY